MKMSLEEAVEVGLRFHRNGQLRQAEQVYQQILGHDPTNADAMHLLGVLAHQAQEYATAIAMISRAILVKPEVATFHYNLAEAYRFSGNLEGAEASLRQTIALEPDFRDAHNNLGLVLLEQRRFAESETSCRAALEIDPAFAGAWNNLGNALRLLGKPEAAIAAYRQAISLRDDFAEAWSNLAICFGQLEQTEAGIEALRTAIRLKPELPDAHNNLGVALLKQGKHDEARKSLLTAIRLKPDFADAQVNMGAALRDVGRPEEAVTFCKGALALKPGFAEAHNNLAVAYRDMGELELALEEAEKALNIRPEYPDALVTTALILKDQKKLVAARQCLEQILAKKPAHALALNCLGLIHLEQGDPALAETLFRQSLASAPDVQTHSNLLLSLNYLANVSPEEIAREHFRWGDEITALSVAKRRPIPIRVHRKLRVGYVSPDFKSHAVSYFIQSFLKNHDREQFELYSYAHVVRPDVMTMLFQSLIPNWRGTTGLNGDNLLKLIREDEIDILVDLAGHTAYTGLPVFAAKPAPVQVSMIGYPNTSGLRLMDYRITDERCDPPGETENLSAEKLWRMPDTFWCYTPEQRDIEINAHDYSHEPIRFCSMNNLAKVTPEATRAWGEILRRVPNSILMMQGGGLHEEATRERIISGIQASGVAGSRVQFSGWTDLATYFQTMADCDIALDTFPFNGGTTTCHKLWMGLPVVAVEGKSHVSRMGHSILSSVGLAELSARDVPGYIETAVALAQDRERLHSLRVTMRDRLRASPLLDEVGYTRHLESAYQHFWASRDAT